MKKLFIFLLFVYLSVNAIGQITKSINITAISGTDTTIWFSADETKWAYPLGIAILAQGTTGAGTYCVLNSPVDSIALVIPTGCFAISSDTIIGITDISMPFNRYGFKLTKGTLSAGIFTMYVSRKTSK